MTSSPLPNYLRTNRKRLAFSQEEVAFLLGVNGENKAIKVCRDEGGTREPSLRMALAYEAIYQKPVRELFAGLYQDVEQEVTARAKILIHRRNRKSNARMEHKRQILGGLAVRTSKQAANQ